MAALSREQLTTFVRGISPRQVRLVSGVVLFAYLVSHFLNHALGNISLEALAGGVYLHTADTHAKRDANFALPADYFDGTVNEPVLHQAVKVYLNNQRQGTHMTKSRSFVSGGNQKPWKQKGTGRARQGSIRAPHWRGGGVVFGPTPRSYEYSIPKNCVSAGR